jgi:energy-coupling factor transporter transmembrane protein EcfT
VCDVSGRALVDEEARASMLALRPVPSLLEEAKDFKDALRF